MHNPDGEPTPHPQETATVPPVPEVTGSQVEIPPARNEDPPAVDSARLDVHPAAPADLRTPLTGFDLLFIVGFYFVSGAVVIPFIIATIMRLFGVSPVSQNFALPNTGIIILNQVLLFAATLAVLFGMIRSRGTADFWPSVGWRPVSGKTKHAATMLRYIFTGSALAAIVGFAGSFLDRDKVLPMEELFHDRQSILLLAGLGILVAPLFEETIFRGCIYPVLARRWGAAASVLVTGILFGSAHAAQLWPGYGQIALLMGVGVVLTYVRARTGTVAASYCVHVGYNTFLFAAIFFGTGGLRHFPS